MRVNEDDDIISLFFILWVFFTVLLINMTDTLLGAGLQVLMTCIIGILISIIPKWSVNYVKRN